jgi:hypothetical protein
MLRFQDQRGCWRHPRNMSFPARIPGPQGSGARASEVETIRPSGGELSPFGELLFFAGAKKSNQKKAPSSTGRSRYVGVEGIFGLGLLPRSENGGHPWPPPLRGFRMLAAAAGPGKSKARGHQHSPTSASDCLDLQPLIFSMLRMRPASGHPEGGRHGCRPFSDQAMDGLSENGDSTAHPLSGVDFTSRCFLWLLSLHQQRK